MTDDKRDRKHVPDADVETGFNSDSPDLPGHQWTKEAGPPKARRETAGRSTEGPAEGDEHTWVKDPHGEHPSEPAEGRRDIGRRP